MIQAKIICVSSTVHLFGVLSCLVFWLSKSDAFLNVNPKCSACQDVKRFQATASDDHQEGTHFSIQRRSFFKVAGFIPAHVASLNKKVIEPAEARGLVKFPCKDYEFLNTYHFLRAGESLLEDEGVWVTNPLFLTNRESALSAKGVEQVEETCRRLRDEGVTPTIVRYSLAASAIDSADILGKELKVGRNNLVPEFNFMDPRAVGKWDMLPLDSTQSAVWALDATEAGNDGKGGRPPANEDSTPHETLADQVVRLQQLISVLETQYSGDTILLVFPDGTGPALLTCLIGGIPLKRVHEFEYQSGEVRLNVNYQSAHKYLFSTPSEEYLEKIRSGEEELKVLRSNADKIMNVREQEFQKELQMENERRERQEREKKEKDLLEMQRRAEISSQKENDDSNGLAIAGVAAVGAIGGAVLFGTKPEEIEIDENPICDTDAESSGVAATDSENIVIDNVPEDTGLVKDTPLLDIKKPVSIPIPLVQEESIDSASSPALVDDSNTGTQKKSLNSWDPNEDDGGEAWLGALSEIMNEEEEEATTSTTDGPSWQ